MPDQPHAHSFVPPGTDTVGVLLLLLHGSGGNELELLPLAGELAPEVARLGIRGTVTIDGGHAFFHRFPDRRVDETDIAARAPVLAEFIEAACDRLRLEQAAHSHRLFQRCDHGGSPATDPSRPVGGGGAVSVPSPVSPQISRSD